MPESSLPLSTAESLAVDSMSGVIEFAVSIDNIRRFLKIWKCF